MKKYILGLDYGNTNLKAAVFDFEGNQCALCTENGAGNEMPYLGWVEQDPYVVWSRMSKAIKGLWQRNIRPEEIAVIGISGFGGGAFLLDENGKPVRKIITSMDSRVSHDERFRRIVASMDENAMGGKPSNPALLLRWIKECEPSNYEKIRWDMMSKDFIRFQLTGVANCEPSDIGTNVFVSKPDLKYNKKVFDLLGVPEMYDRMPPLINAWEISGTVTEKAAEETGLCAGTPVAAGAHDCVAASLGIGSYRTGQLSVTAGSFAVNLMVGTDEPQPFAPGFPVRNCPSILPGRWMMINQAHVGKAADWFIQNLAMGDVIEAKRRNCSVFRVLESRAGRQQRTGLQYLPFVAALRDTEIRDARIGFYGARIDSTYDELVLAMYEGVAYSEAYMLRLMTEVVEAESVFITGGASNDYLCQILANLMDISVKVPDVEQASCRGAALAAGVAAGIYRDHAQAVSLPIRMAREYFPQKEMQNYHRDKFEQFIELTKANISAYAAH